MSRMPQIKGDAVEQLAHRLAYTVGSSCQVLRPEEAADIVGREFNKFISQLASGEGDTAVGWRVLVARCVERVNALDLAEAA